MKNLIKKLVETPSPSGFEYLIRDLIREEIESFCQEINTDSFGNLIAKTGSQDEKAKSLMIAGHMDEIGIMVTHIEDNGFVRFTTIGGVRPFTCIGGRVVFTNGVHGVIGTERIKDPTKMPCFEMMYIDVGASDRDSCPVKVGDAAAFERPFMDLGKRIVSKAMDDRIACAVMIEALKRTQNSPHTLYYVFTCQEEVGLRGARVSTYHIKPDIGIAVDVTGVGDTPKGVTMQVSLGKGPAIKIRDESLITNPVLVKWAIETAEKKGIPYQREVLIGGGTDAGAINLTGSGVPAICLSIPTRYIHSPSEMVDMDDVLHTIDLLVELISNPFKLE